MYNFKIKDEAFARGYLGCDSDSPFVRAGYGYIEACKATDINADENTGLPWCALSNMAVITTPYGGQSPNIGWLEGKAKEDPENAADYQYIIDNMRDLDVGAHIWSSFTEDENNIWRATAAWGGTWGGHSVPDLIDFARYGTDGLREKLNRFKAINIDIPDFYDGMLLLLDAVDILGQRVHDLAVEKLSVAETDKQKKKLQRLIDTFSRCPKQPAVTFMDACCVYVMIYTLDAVDSPGHFDWYMEEFWNRTPYAEAREMLEDMWEFFHNTRSWNLCISGSDENWNDKSNDLTYEILDVCAKYKYQTPNLTMRCHRNTPEKLLRAAAKAMAAGTGMPTLYNDEAMCPALERLGIAPRDSHLYVMNGCNQVDIQGKSHMGLEDGEVNLGVAVEMVFTNGVHRKSEKKIGVETGDVSELDTFEKFYAAVKAQVAHLCDAACSMSNKSQRQYARYSVNPIRTLTTEGCLIKGKDYKNGGPLYGHGQILAEGVPDSIDSIANVKKFVYDEQKYTLAQVRDALAADFEGYEEMYLDFKNSGLNFGNDIPYVDEIGGDLVDFYNNYLMTIPTVRGGFFSGGCSPFVRAAQNGRAVGALPNGKKFDEYLYGDSIGATPGRDINGPTALLSSCLSFDHTLPTSGFILNVRFDKNLFDTEKGVAGFIALYHAYFDNKGQQLSVTVLNREDLLDAMENPDAHRGLIVRVGGYSDYFVNLGRDLQENIVARTDHDI